MLRCAALQMSRVRLSAKALDGLRANTEQDVLHYQVPARDMLLPAVLIAWLGTVA
jgi:hypothetical protein